MNGLVSIVVPVYGVEQYLEECVNSLLAQTHDKLEIILVDDGSPDSCGALCDAYAEKDNRIKVIHKPNGGAASARNAGLDVARGDYICLVDSDDAVAPDYVERLLNRLTEERADIAVCGFTQHSKVGNEPSLDCEPSGTYTGQAYLAQFLKNWTCALLWNKMFRRETIGKIRMEEGHRIDDEFFTYQVVMNAEKVVVFETPLYHYRLRKSGVMQSGCAAGQRMMLDRIEYIQKRYAHVCELEPELQTDFFADMTDSFARFWAACAESAEVKRQVGEWKRKNLWNILTSKLTLKKKMIYICALYLKAPGKNTVESPVDISTEHFFA